MKFTEKHLRRLIREAIQESTDKDLQDYQDWAKKNGHTTPASSSVLASYLIDSGKDSDQDLIKKLSQSLESSDDNSKDFHSSVNQDVKRQKDEKSASSSSSSSNATVKSESLRRMIQKIVRENKI